MDLIFLREHTLPLFLGAVSSFAVLTVWIWLRVCSSHELLLPPGPPGYPIIGGLRTMPSTHQWYTFAEWGKTWGEELSSFFYLGGLTESSGDLIYTSLFGLPIIVINSIDVARDLLDKRGSNFSDRPKSVVFCEM